MEPAAPLGAIPKLLLAAEVLGLCARALAVTRRRGVLQALATLRDEPMRSQRQQRAVDPKRLARATTAILSPLRVRCLIRSLVLSGLLARRGVASKLVIGVKDPANFGAHAWVELDRSPLLPAHGHEFARITEL